jgi:hypothetical protein
MRCPNAPRVRSHSPTVAALGELLDSVRIWLRVPANCVLWALRRRFGARLSRPERPPRLRSEPKAGVFAHLPIATRAAADARARELTQRYGLTRLRAEASRAVWLENLTMLDVLEQAGEAGATERPRAPVVRAVDVGSRNWTYVHALLGWLAGPDGRDGGRPDVELTGIEIDGYWLNRDGRTRCDHARAHADLAVGDRDHVARYEVADFTTWRPTLPDRSLDVVTMFFPFVTAHALVAWGLPPWLLAPQRLFARAFALLGEGGRLVTWHQTAAEAEVARRIARVAGFVLVDDRAWCSVFASHPEGEGRRQLVFRRPARPFVLPAPTRAAPGAMADISPPRPASPSSAAATCPSTASSADRASS